MYALVVGLTFFDYAEARATLDSLDLTSLEWGEWIGHFFSLTGRITQYYVKQPQQPTVGVKPNLTSGSSVNRLPAHSPGAKERTDNADI